MRRLSFATLLLAVACTTTNPLIHASPDTSGSPPPDCPTACASQRDACLQKAGPSAAPGAPAPVDQKAWDLRFAQQKAAQACTDDYASCSGGCH